MKNLHQAFVELAKRVPADLDSEKEFKVEGVPLKFTYDDEHEFSIRVPAWVLRVVKKHYSTMEK